MNEQASKSSRRNHSSKTSKIASSCSSGVEPRLLPPLRQAHGSSAARAFEEGEHEIVLRREVPVERRLGDPGVFDHLIDADRLDPPLREQLVRAIQDSFTSLRLALAVSYVRIWHARLAYR